MLDSVKKTLLAGLGAVAFTHDKLRSVIDDLVERGELTAAQGRKLFDTLVERGQEQSDELASGILGESRSIRDLLPVTRLELHKVVERVEKLEARLGMSTPPATEDGARADEGMAGAGATPPFEYPGEALPPRDDV